MGIKQRTEHKRLTVLLEKLEGEMEALKMQKNSISQEIQAKNTQVMKVRSELKKLNKASDNIIISEHAILRYLERVKKIDIELLSGEILTPKVIEAYDKLGDGKYPINNQYKVVIKDNVVLTVIDN